MKDTEWDAMMKISEVLRGVEFVKNDSTLQQELYDLEHKIVQDYFMVVVLGEFKRGKSSFINALLGKEILPTDVLPETATINMVFYNEKPNLQVVYKNGHKEQGEVSLEYLRKFSANVADNLSKSVNYINIGYPLEMLKNRIVLVDTPGVADLEDMRTDITYGFLPKAHAVIFLLDANTPLTQTEKEFIEERLSPQGINDILFIVNKYDCIDDEEDEDFLDELKLRLDTVFKIGTAAAKLRSFTLLPFSATTALRGIERGDSKLLIASGMYEVRKQLLKIMSTGSIAQKKKHYAKVNLQKIAHHIITNIDKKIAITQASIDELSLIEQTLLEEINSRAIHRSAIDSYVISIQDTILSICNKSLQIFARKLREDISEQIELYQGDDFKNFIEKYIARRIQKNVENWIGLYFPHIKILIKKLERELSIGLSQNFNQQIQLKTTSYGEFKSLKQSLQLTATDISDVSFQAGAIAAAGGIGLLAIAGATIMPLISFAALPYLRSYMLKKKLVEVKQEITPLISSQINKVSQQLGEEIHNYVTSECQKVKENTDYAYNTLLNQLKQNISIQVNEKRSLSADKQISMVKLKEDAKRVEDIMSSIGGS